jgi:hypothetical protein
MCLPLRRRTNAARLRKLTRYPADLPTRDLRDGSSLDSADPFAHDSADRDQRMPSASGPEYRHRDVRVENDLPLITKKRCVRHRCSLLAQSGGAKAAKHCLLSAQEQTLKIWLSLSSLTRIGHGVVF